MERSGGCFNMYGIIYLITNKITGDRYVGQTTEILRKRWNRHCGKWTNCAYLSNAINKYGRKNFTIKPLAYANNQEELDHREKYCIKLFNTQVPNGYNILPGGSKAINPALVGRILTTEERKKISETLKNFYDDPENLMNSVIRQSSRKEIFCYQTGQVYVSIGDAARKLGLKSEGKIADIVNGKKVNYNGYTFCLAEDAPKQDFKIKDLEPIKNNKISVFCHQNGKVYASIKEAAQDLNLEGKRISAVLVGKRNSHKGYSFSYADNVDLNNIEIKDFCNTKSGDSMAVKCNENGIVYFSIKEAARQLGLKPDSKITDIIKGRLKSYKGYTFSRVEDSNVI